MASICINDILYLSGERTKLKGVWRVESIRTGYATLRNRYITDFYIVKNIEDLELDLLASDPPTFTLTDLSLFCDAKGFSVLDKVQEYFNEVFLDLLPIHYNYSKIIVREDKIRDMKELELENFLKWFYILYVKES